MDPPPPEAPPPVSGGTLLVTHDGQHVVASDPARDQVFVINLLTSEIEATIDLQKGDEPGRLVEDAAGRIHVALRHGGALVTIVNGQIADRRDVCPEPRGVAFEPSTGLLHVACAGGELVSLPAAGGAEVRRLLLDRDLRDVVVADDALLVSRFRSAEMLTLAADGTIINRIKPPSVSRTGFSADTFEEQSLIAQAEIAWRTVRLPDGTVIMVHQRATGGPLSVQPGGYETGGCGDGPVEATATVFDGKALTASRKFAVATLPVDIAGSYDGQYLAIALAGNQTVRLIRRGSLGEDEDPCGFDPGDMELSPQYGMPTSVAFTPDGAIVTQSDNAIVVDEGGATSPGLHTTAFVLSTPYVANRGQRLFHKATSSGLACASCHPEGREDGLVWDFGGFGKRRTQSLAGDLLERAPYHWTGDMHDLDQLAEEVLVSRMGGEQPTSEEMDELKSWLGQLRPLAPSPPIDALAVERGRGLFNDLGCATCHSGPLYTNNTMQDVGTGGTFKVPSLVSVANRAPFLHTGCAATLRDRFDPSCGGVNHGNVDQLSDAEMGDLIAFLSSL